MADEAVVRIILQDQGVGVSSQTTVDPPSSVPTAVDPQSRRNTSSPQQSTTIAVDKYLEAEAKAALEIIRRHQLQEKRDEELFELEAKAALDVARRRQAAAEEARRAEIANEDRKRELIEIEAKAALAVVRKQQEAAEDARRKTEEAERNKETEMDQIFKILDPFRGTIGGLGGTSAGAALDIGKALQGMKSGAAAEGAAGAEVAGGSLAGAAAAAGPIAAIAVAVKMVADAVNRAIVDTIKGGISTVGSIASGIASSSADPSVPIERMGDAASKVGDKLVENYISLGFLAIAAGESAKALSGLMRELDSTANRYAEFSPQISQAQAVSEIQQTMGDLRRAQEVGPELARYVQEQGELQQRFEDIKIKLLTRLLAVVNPILEGVEGAIAMGEGIERAISSLLAPLAAIPGAGALIAQVIQDESRPPLDDPTSILFKEGREGVQVPEI